MTNDPDFNSKYILSGQYYLKIDPEMTEAPKLLAKEIEHYSLRSGSHMTEVELQEKLFGRKCVK